MVVADKPSLTGTQGRLSSQGGKVVLLIPGEWSLRTRNWRRPKDGGSSLKPTDAWLDRLVWVRVHLCSLQSQAAGRIPMTHTNPFLPPLQQYLKWSHIYGIILWQLPAFVRLTACQQITAVCQYPLHLCTGLCRLGLLRRMQMCDPFMAESVVSLGHVLLSAISNLHIHPGAIGIPDASRPCLVVACLAGDHSSSLISGFLKQNLLV